MADTTTKLTQLKYIQRVTGKDSKGKMALEPMIVGANAYIYTNKNILLTDAGTPTSSFGTNSAYIGTNVSGSGNNSAYIGTNVSGSGNNSIYLGTEIKGSGTNQLIIGQYNESTNKAFVIGNGTDKQHPSDIFTVATNGDIESAGNLTVKGITSKGALTVTGEFTVQNQNGAKWLAIQPPTTGASVASATLFNLTSIDMIASDTLNLEAEAITISGSKSLELSDLDSLTVTGATSLQNGATVTGGNLVIKNKYSLQTPIIRALGDVLTIQGSASERLMHFHNGVIWCDNTLGILGSVRGNKATDDIQFLGGIYAKGTGTFKQLSITDSSTFDGLITANGGITTNGLTNTDISTFDGLITANNGLKVQKSILTDGLTNTGTTSLTGNLTANGGITVANIDNSNTGSLTIGATAKDVTLSKTGATTTVNGNLNVKGTLTVGALATFTNATADNIITDYLAPKNGNVIDTQSDNGLYFYSNKSTYLSIQDFDDSGDFTKNGRTGKSVKYDIKSKENPTPIIQQISSSASELTGTLYGSGQGTVAFQPNWCMVSYTIGEPTGTGTAQYYEADASMTIKVSAQNRHSYGDFTVTLPSFASHSAEELAKGIYLLGIVFAPPSSYTDASYSVKDLLVKEQIECMTGIYSDGVRIIQKNDGHVLTSVSYAWTGEFRQVSM